MIINGSHSRPTAIRATIQFLVRSKWIFTLAIAALVTVAAMPPAVSDENSDEEYIRIMNLMDRADVLRATGKADAAKAKDQEAYRDLIIFQKTHPKWNTKTVEYRLNQLAQEIEGRPKESEEPMKSKGRTNLEAPAKHASTATTSTATVKLVDAGAEPRKPMRLHVKTGDKQTIILTVKSSGAETGGNIPALSIPADVTVQSVASNGDITYETVIGTPGLADETNAPPQAAQIKAALASLNGLTIAAVVSDRGVSKKAEVKAGAVTNPMMSEATEEIKENMANLAVPFPEEAIGNGAKWEVKGRTKSGGASMAETVNHQLVSVDGDHLSTTFTMSASASDQKVQTMGMQIHILEATNEGSGADAVDLSKVIPLQKTADLNTETKGEAGGKSFDRKQSVNMSMEAH